MLFLFAKRMSLQNPAMNGGRSDILWSRLETFPPKDNSPFLLICEIRKMSAHNILIDGRAKRYRVVCIAQ